MKRKNELFALGVVVFLVVIFPAALLGYQFARSTVPGARTIDVTARLPDDGGFAPDVIRVNRGERVRLRLSAPDVVHGFEIPALGVRAPDIYPGHVVEVTFTPEQVGRFAFACTRWCSAGHWRMRGVIEVIDPADPGAMARRPTSEPPLYQKLGLDLDALPQLDPQVEHSLGQLAELPSAVRGEALKLTLPAELRDRAWLTTHTPGEAFLLLRNDEAYSAWSDAQLDDAVAFAWRSAATQTMLARGAELYTRDCAACHGAQGKGNGPAGRDLPGLAAMMPDTPAPHAGAGVKRGPADLSDVRRMFALSDAHLQGKLLRGGMGTGMPEFGSLYSSDDQWAVIAFVRGFAMSGGE
jgi:mono/diheme cytochrome c family protein